MIENVWFYKSINTEKSGNQKLVYFNKYSNKADDYNKSPRMAV